MFSNEDKKFFPLSERWAIGKKSDKEMFNQEAQLYQEAVTESRYMQKLNPPNNIFTK